MNFPNSQTLFPKITLKNPFPKPQHPPPPLLSKNYRQTGLINMTSVARGLSGLDAHHDLLRLNRPERVDDDLALHGLQRVDH
jgi:hypothetical protein